MHEIDLLIPLPEDEIGRAPLQRYFTLKKGDRTSIERRSETSEVRIDASPEFGMPTIEDADYLLWFAYAIRQNRKLGLQANEPIVCSGNQIWKDQLYWAETGVRETAPEGWMPRAKPTKSRKDRSAKNGRGPGESAYETLRKALLKLSSASITVERYPQIKRWIEGAESIDAEEKTGSKAFAVSIPEWFHKRVVRQADEDAPLLPGSYFALNSRSRWLYHIINREMIGRDQADFSVPQLIERYGNITKDRLKLEVRKFVPLRRRLTGRKVENRDFLDFPDFDVDIVKPGGLFRFNRRFARANVPDMP